jgi:hypothetical protein
MPFQQIGSRKTYASAFCVSGFLLLFAACNSDSPDMAKEINKRTANRWIAQSINDAAIRNAIVTQHTLYPYHFESGKRKLNGLGKQALKVLIQYYKNNPGHLNVRRGDTPDNLYQSRCDYILEKMDQCGVNAQRMKLADGLPGGRGMSSEEVIRILQKEAEDKSYSDGGSGVGQELPLSGRNGGSPTIEMSW